MDDKLRVLVVDDTVTYRKAVSSVLAGMPDVEVLGTAANGKIALDKAAHTPTDLLLLDVEMPEVDGVEVLRRLQAAGSPIGAIMLSALTAQGAQTTLTCLALGAFDFVLKPTAGSYEESTELLRRELRPRLAAFARQRCVRTAQRGPMAATPAAAPRPPAGPVSASPSALPKRVDVVALGISTGGPKALGEMLPRFPADFPVPIVIVQHMPPVFTKSLADDLDKRCALRVLEAYDGHVVRPGEVLVAPGGKQMKVERRDDRVVVCVTDDPPENSCRPAVDYLFRSVAAVYGERAVGVIMTGMGNDGSAGCRVLKARGAQIVVQDEASCVVFGMPRQPTEEGIADVVAPLDRLAAELVSLVAKGRSACR